MLRHVICTALIACSFFQLAQSQFDPNCNDKQVIVQLFEWKWTDIANECEAFLGPAGYCGVLVSPPNEHIVENQQPWWIRYQPVSYILHSRSGTPDQFAEMVDRCNDAGVRIYVDAVINHMAAKNKKGTGSGGSAYDGTTPSFPEVPYSAQHFTPKSSCPTSSGDVENEMSENEIRNCYLLGLTDLYGADPAVQSAISGYLNHLVDLGVAGVRIDAAKYMWPEDLKAILWKVKQLPTSKGFKAGSTLFVYNDVIHLDNADPITPDKYYDIGLVTDATYVDKISKAFGEFGLNFLGNPEHDVRDDRAYIFVDNHDSQRGGWGLGDTVTYKTPADYKMAVAFTLAYPFGFTQIMSSYAFTDTNQGPPSNSDGSTADVTVNPDGSCSGGWVCEHRWNAIAKLVEFRNKMKGLNKAADEFTSDYVAFSRGTAAAADGYFIMAKKIPFTASNKATGLPVGKHCNIIDNGKTCIDVREGGLADISLTDPNEPIFAWCKGCNEGPIPTLAPVVRSTTPMGSTTFTPPTVPCTGDWCPTSGTTAGTPYTGSTTTATTPSGTGTTTTTTKATTTRPSGTGSTTFVPPTAPCIGEFCPTERPVDMRRTVVFIKKQLSGVDDFMFIRGGLDESHFSACEGITNATISPCSITINITRLGSSEYYQKANAFSSRDTLLDWYGMQAGQGTYFSRQPLGTPVISTSNSASSINYQPLNTFGDNYQMVDFNMDYYMTEDEWFDFRGIIDIYNSEDDIEEGDITQSACTGTGGGVSPPGPPTKNHRGRVGYINVFEWGTGSCVINEFTGEWYY